MFLVKVVIEMNGERFEDEFPLDEKTNLARTLIAVRKNNYKTTDFFVKIAEIGADFLQKLNKPAP